MNIATSADVGVLTLNEVGELYTQGRTTPEDFFTPKDFLLQVNRMIHADAKETRRKAASDRMKAMWAKQRAEEKLS